MNRTSNFLVIAALGLAACAQEAATPDPAVVAAPVPGDPAVPVPGEDAISPSMGGALPAFATRESGAENASTGPEAPVLRDVRIAAHEGFDRIVFEFDSDGLPQWHVDYIDPPVVQCGSGQAMPVAGAAWLQVRFNGANAHTEAGEATSGPLRRSPDLASVREVVRTCDFEAEVSWVVGMAGLRSAYRSVVLEDPARLVIDIAH